MITNYHSHTVRCKHASGSEEDYVKAAIANGYSVLGFSDHCPWVYEDGFVSSCRMFPEQFDDYASSVRAVQDKYKDQITVHLAIECEYFPAKMAWLTELCDQYSVDYIILGNHFERDESMKLRYFGGCKTHEDLHAYVDMTTQGMQTGLYAYLAHPDLCFRSVKEFDSECDAVARELCRCANAMHMPLEYNLLGVLYARGGHHSGLGYPCSRFWEIAAEEGVTAIIGVDAHKVNQIEDMDTYHQAEAYLSSLGLEPIKLLPFDQGKA